MSGAQPKAADIAGATSIVAEVDESRIHIRYEQGWVNHIAHSLEEAFEMARKGIESKKPTSIAYLGNVVDLLEYAYAHDIHIDPVSYTHLTSFGKS